MLHFLAIELVLLICDQLDSERDVSALARASQKLYGVLSSVLYLRNATYSGSSALLWAISSGQHITAERAVTAWAALLRTKVSDESTTGPVFYGHNAFVRAAEQGSDLVARMMTETGMIDINWRDPGHGRTALGWAAMCGNSSVLGFLVGLKDVLLDPTDYYGQTPLSLAAQTGNLTSVKLLLRTERVNPNAVDRLQLRTPLAWAALRGRLEIMKELMRLREVDVDPVDVRGWTPLSLACQGGYADAAAELLATGLVDVNSKDRFWRRTPLIWAAFYGEENVVRVLLRSEDIVAGIADIRGHTALSLAVQGGVGRVTRLLLDSGKVDLGSIDFVYGKSPLQRGVYSHRPMTGLKLPALRPP